MSPESLPLDLYSPKRWSGFNWLPELEEFIAMVLACFWWGLAAIIALVSLAIALFLLFSIAVGVVGSLRNGAK